MSKNLPIPKAQSMYEISKMDQKLALERIARSTFMFVELAKFMICFRPNLPTGQTMFGKLEKEGIRKHSIRNARQAERVWEDYVAPGHIDETWFDRLTYKDCVAINDVTKKRGAEFTKCLLTDLKEIHHINKTGAMSAELSVMRLFISRSNWMSEEYRPNTSMDFIYNSEVASLQDFVDFVKLIRAIGRHHYLSSDGPIYLEVDGWEYWTADNLDPYHTIRINRQKL